MRQFALQPLFALMLSDANITSNVCESNIKTTAEFNGELHPMGQRPRKTTTSDMLRRSRRADRCGQKRALNTRDGLIVTPYPNGGFYTGWLAAGALIWDILENDIGPSPIRHAASAAVTSANST